MKHYGKEKRRDGGGEFSLRVAFKGGCFILERGRKREKGALMK